MMPDAETGQSAPTNKDLLQSLKYPVNEFASKWRKVEKPKCF